MSKIVMIQGLGWGDEGKGSVVDFFTRGLSAKHVVRFNGGSQAGHTVQLADGTRHVFSQFSSGTFAGAGTYLSKYMMVNPISMYNEALKLKKLGVSLPMDLITVSPDSLVTTAFHAFANRMREEKRGNNKHGSCGMGIGETVDYSLKFPETALRVNDITVKSLAKEKMTAIRNYYAKEFEIDSSSPNIFNDSTVDLMLNDMFSWINDVTVVPDEDAIISMLEEGNLVFEGAQGVLLDETHGFKPHNTWSDCTFGNVNKLLKYVKENHEMSAVGVLRCYSTRHGAGPFVTESSDLKDIPKDKTNITNESQGKFRLGYFDEVLAKYALKAIGGIDELVLTCMDHTAFIADYKVCSSYNIKGKITDSLLKWSNPVLKSIKVKDIIPYLSEELNVNIRLTSYGPTPSDKKVI